MSGKMGDAGRTMTTRSMAKEGKQHPLMNHLVLDKVFEYCSVKDLKVVRMVSPVWRDCARKKWDQSVKLRIIGGLEKFQLFLQMMESDDQNPPLGTGVQGSWMTLCAQLKRLEICDITLPTVQALRNALFRFPNLEHLNLETIEVLEVGILSSERSAPEPFLQPEIQDQQRNLKSFTVRWSNGSAHLPISWMEVFAHFPSLERIYVSAPAVRLKTQTLFQAVNRIREEDPSKLKLKHVSIRITAHAGEDEGLPPDVRTTLMDKRLHLETLEYDCFYGGMAIICLRDILQVHAGTLEILAFRKGPDVTFSQDAGFPELTKLKELRMLLISSSESVDFLKFTPNLKKLKLSSYDDYDNLPRRHSSFMGFPIMLSALKELDICDGLVDFQRTFSPENWRSLMEWTPNLESLKIVDVDNAKFAMICECWTKLVKLYVYRSDVDASGITGWDEENVKRFDSMKRSKRTAALPSITVPRANITGLKSLQIFTMSTLSWPPIKLSRAAGVYGIEMLPDLRRLCMKNYEMMPKDRDYWNRMHERYPLPK